MRARVLFREMRPIYVDFEAADEFLKSILSLKYQLHIRVALICHDGQTLALWNILGCKLITDGVETLGLL
jgi:hypothetical protein